MAKRRGRRKSHTASAPLIDIPAPLPDAKSPQAARDRHRTVSRLAARLTEAAVRSEKVAKVMPVEPTPEQLANQRYGPRLIHEPGTARQRIMRFARQSALDRYRARELISDRQHDAAERYREDWTQGGYDQAIIARYDGGGGTSAGTAPGPPFTDTQLDARTRWRAARAVLPQRLAPLFDLLVLDDADAAAVGARDGRAGAQAARFAIEYVRICADELADWYRLPGG